MNWVLGLPSSSSHALFGGLIGAAIVGSGFGAINLSILLSNIVLPAALAPVTAGLVPFLATRLAHTTTKKKQRDGFRIGQIFTSRFRRPTLVAALATWVAGLASWGIIVDAAVAVVVIVAIFLYSRRSKVTSRSLAVEPTQFVRPKRRGRQKSTGPTAVVPEQPAPVAEG